ncbi:MAG: aminotransferase class I/II-fold pyridoxal phosphate-dependent enzyme [Bacillota bacterium]
MKKTKSLIKGLKSVKDENLTSFHMPGHKNNKKIYKYIENNNLLDLDITEIPGTDNLHDPKNIIKKSQKDLSKIFNSKKSYFLVNGSTCGILSTIYSVTNKNDKILINRNAHKSVLNAVKLNELNPLHIKPKLDSKTDLICGIDIKDLKYKLKNFPKIKVVFLTYPTYEGICYNLKKVVKIIKSYNKFIIIDEAHGSHFKFSTLFPDSGTNFKVDAVIQSAHKNGLTLTQGAYLHIFNKSIIKNVENYLKIFQTSSPSYIIMASLDANLKFFKNKGKIYSEKLNKNIKKFSNKLKETKFINLNNLDIGYDYDFSKLIISPLKLGINGNDLEKILRKKYKIQVEYSTYNYCLLIASVFNKSKDFEKLLKALKSIEKTINKKSLSFKKGLILENINIKYRPSELKKYSFKKIKVNKSLNKIAYESVIPYPPGIPLIMPGEIITKEALEKISIIKNEIKVLEENNEKRNN